MVVYTIECQLGKSKDKICWASHWNYQDFEEKQEYGGSLLEES